MSLLFYGWWNPVYLWIIISSILFNYYIGIWISRCGKAGGRWKLILGVTSNLSMIAYFKYANFFIDSVNQVAESSFSLPPIVLPLAISFFTFQQIAYLIDVYHGKKTEYDFLHYSLFVTFFPQLIAGPIVHHKEMLPQFARKVSNLKCYNNLSIGITIFSLGLFKKVMLADSLALYATPVFDAAAQGVTVSFFESWGAALAYTLQLYFDFSGYSDMAIGLARLFGIKLPLNFDSPYKSKNIIDFWRRWHITLSRFLREHLYIPLGGNRQGGLRSYFNIMMTMLLAGLWHGAGWTFIAWGALHGIYLLVNHMWQKGWGMLWHEMVLYRVIAQSLTFVSIVVSWVLFRSENFVTAKNLLSTMAGVNGISVPLQLKSIIDPLIRQSFLSEMFFYNGMFYNDFADWKVGIPLIVVSIIICVLAPNTQQIMSHHHPVLEHVEVSGRLRAIIPQHSFTYRWACVVTLILICSVIFASRTGEFLYFNF